MHASSSSHEDTAIVFPRSVNFKRWRDTRVPPIVTANGTWTITKKHTSISRERVILHEQIGDSCLRLFLHTNTAHSILHSLRAIHSLKQIQPHTRVVHFRYAWFMAGIGIQGASPLAVETAVQGLLRNMLLCLAKTIRLLCLYVG
jgi:hypothetical protein